MISETCLQYPYTIRTTYEKRKYGRGWSGPHKNLWKNSQKFERFSEALNFVKNRHTYLVSEKNRKYLGRPTHAPLPLTLTYNLTYKSGCRLYLMICVNYSLVCISKTNASF